MVSRETTRDCGTPVPVCQDQRSVERPVGIQEEGLHACDSAPRHPRPFVRIPFSRSSGFLEHRKLLYVSRVTQCQSSIRHSRVIIPIRIYICNVKKYMFIYTAYNSRIFNSYEFYVTLYSGLVCKRLLSTRDRLEKRKNAVMSFSSFCLQNHFKNLVSPISRPAVAIFLARIAQSFCNAKQEVRIAI